MARIVTKSVKGPMEIKPQKESVWICICGLSKNQPFCDGSHKMTLDEKEDTTYCYDEKGKREVLDSKGSCCGDGYCQKE